LAFIVSQFDTRVRTHREAARILGLPVVARVPRVPRDVLRDGPLVTLTDPDGGVAEALRVLRSNLDWTRVDGDVKSLMISSSQKGEGKTLMVCNLAVTLALAGKKVVLVDADLRDPRVHTSFSMPNGNGLSTVIQGSLALEDALRPFDVDRNGQVVRTSTVSAASRSTSQSGTLLVLTSGPLPPNPGEVIASRRMAAVLKNLAESDVDYVLIDTPPVLVVGDAGALAPSVDGLLFVANLNETRQPTLEDGREALDALPCRKLGVVIVGERLASSAYHHYGYAERRRSAL
jgi:Mrp family chromosome partitioning ATPase